MKRNIIRLTAVLVALCTLFCVTSCSSKGKTLLTLKKDGVTATLSVNQYELMLSRLKGYFVGYGYQNDSGSTADTDAFWDLKDSFDGTLKTWDEQYRSLILENAKTYVVALWLFEKEGLSLSESVEEEIQAEMEEIITDYGNGSKTKLNAVLSDFGVNYNLLKQSYLIEAKIDALQAHLYGANGSGLGTTVKDEYLNENYIRFKQIFLANYHYVYVTDDYGDTVYYDTSTGKPLYDSVHGVTHTEGGKTVVDSSGQTIYFLSAATDSHICYDTENGEPSVSTDEDGNAVTKAMSSAELATLQNHAEELAASLEDATAKQFESAMTKEGVETTFTDGYYLKRGQDYTSYGEDLAYLTTIANTLDEIEVGEVRMLESSSGYHIIMKYEPTSGAYSNEVNEVWFGDFISNLVEELFLEECRAYFSEITVNETVLATVPSLKKIGVNYYF